MGERFPIGVGSRLVYEVTHHRRNVVRVAADDGDRWALRCTNCGEEWLSLPKELLGAMFCPRLVRYDEAAHHNHEHIPRRCPHCKGKELDRMRDATP